MSYEPEVSKQNSVYADFRAWTDSLTELVADPCIASSRAGYIVAFRHNVEVMEPFSRFTASLRRSIPTVPYDASNGHTTITVHEKRPLAGFQPDPATLAALCRAVRQIDRQLCRQVRIDFQDWYLGPESVIVAGLPNDAFWEVGRQLRAAGLEYGLNLRMPWGAHMTAARFTKDCDADTVAILRRELRNAPVLGISAPIAIEVGCYTSGIEGFALKAVETFALS
jgi:hypothetical protein